MAKQAVLVVCPGRGTYGASELGTFARSAGHSDLARFDAMRAGGGAPTLSELDGAAKFSPSLHTKGPNAAPLIYTAGWLDFLALDQERFEVVAVTGNSMGFYTALACAGAVSGEHGFRIADAMGSHSGRHGDGGQLLVSLTGEDWRVDPALRAAVLARAAKHGAMLSIDLGAMLVLAGTSAALDALARDLPPPPGRAAMRLAGHGPFHTPLMAESSHAALASLPPDWFGRPQVPLIDGTGRIWRNHATDPAALYAYTFGAQILEPYDFATAIAVGIKEFAPDRIVLVGPGDTLGGAIGQVLVREGWLGMRDKAGFAERQAADPFLLAMGRADQRAGGEAAMTLAEQTGGLLDRMGVRLAEGDLACASPIDGSSLGSVRQHTAAEVDTAIAAAHRAFLSWRAVPAPRRGELVRLLGEELRAHKDELGALVSIEVGKVRSEGLGEVQEMIDICDFAVGLSRQLHGLSIVSERPEHRMMEQWHPLGVVGIVTAFNFPVAVWAWNAALALVCGNALVWKPSEKAPLCALAVQALFERAVARFGDAPEGLAQLVIGERDVGEALVDNPAVALVSATGSVAMGRAVGPRVAARFGRSLLELGGNNAAIVAPSADLDLALRGVVFAAMGTAGQRCTTLRRLFVHEGVYDAFVARLKAAYASVSVGDPLEPGTLVGPLIDEAAFDAMQRALDQARAMGGRSTAANESRAPGLYARPALVEMPAQTGPVLDETFAPILYVLRYTDLAEAIALNNAVPQGLSSAIFTTDLREAEAFVAATGSDCGIANVNIGTSGAEIGGAFGGEKETGGGRESGSDSWRAYMRRATNTINYGNTSHWRRG